LKIVKHTPGKYSVISNENYIVKFNSQPQAPVGKDMYCFDSVEEVIETMANSNFKYGITIKPLRGGWYTVHEARNPQGFAKWYPEYFI
jgi:hypothetical protein